jgi:hypothetical protein
MLPTVWFRLGSGAGDASRVPENEMSKAAPSSVEGIKRFAKEIASRKGIKHTAALDEAAQLAGYQTFIHAKRVLAKAGAPRPPTLGSQNRRYSEMNYSDFHLKNRARWSAAVNDLAHTGDASLRWTALEQIEQVLKPFLGENYSHAHLPTGGGLDYRSVKKSRELGCLEFAWGSGAIAVAKPKALTIERINEDVAESTVLLELGALQTTGVYDEERSEREVEFGQEEVLEIDGRYYARDGVDDGYYRDERGRERDLPERWRLVSRWLRGQILIVAKGSLWNGTPKTYSGLHNSMNSTEIRRLIEKSIRVRESQVAPPYSAD